MAAIGTARRIDPYSFWGSPQILPGSGSQALSGWVLLSDRSWLAAELKELEPSLLRVGT